MITEKLYIIFDKDAQVAIKPALISRNDVAPIREFTQAINNPESLMNKYPASFELYLVGEINLITLAIQPEQPRVVITGEEALLKQA